MCFVNLFNSSFDTHTGARQYSVEHCGFIVITGASFKPSQFDLVTLPSRALPVYTTYRHIDVKFRNMMRGRQPVSSGLGTIVTLGISGISP